MKKSSKSEEVGDYFKGPEKDREKYIRNIEVILEYAGSKKADLICSTCNWQIERLAGGNCSREGCVRNRN